MSTKMMFIILASAALMIFSGCTNYPTNIPQKSIAAEVEVMK